MRTDGQAINRMREAQRARWRGTSLGIVFQFFALLPTMTLLNNVMLPMELAGRYAPVEHRERAAALLTQVGLGDHLHKLPSRVSGGQQQRAAIARSIANNPPLVLGDEPTGNLVSGSTEVVFELLSTLVADGLTLALTTLLHGLAPASPLISVLAVLGAASAFPWLQHQANRLITRTFYPERLTFDQEVRAVQEHLIQVVRRTEIVSLLTKELPERLGVEWAYLQLLPNPPPSKDGVWSAPMLVGGRQIGVYWLGLRRTGLPFAPDEQVHLQSVVQQAALALGYAESYESLAALNAELEDRVVARTEQLVAHQRELAAVAERQRLARDLHDSLKQTLFSLGLNLHAAAGLVRRNPERTRELLVQQAERVVAAQSELAELLSDLRTTPRGQTDLAALLRSEAAEVEMHHGFQVLLDVPPQLELDESVARELAAVVREALHNVLKHSGTNRACLSLQSDVKSLVLVISDDGRGFALDEMSATSYGLRGMRERITALGGTVTIIAAEGEGTQLWVRIPERVASEF